MPQDIVAGTYGRVTVSGVCRFNGDVTINGGLVVAAGGVLNSHASGVPFMTAHVVINGDVQVQNGAVLGLGNYGPPGIKTNTVVNGNIVADRPLDLYLSGITVHGSVVSNGGGPGTSQFLNFPTKDDTIDGNLIMNGWQGGWIGAIRDTVGGNVLVSNNASVVHETPVGCDDMDPNPANHCTGFAPGPDTDSTEVVTNTITGNLICVGNTPAAQVGDSGGLPNVVGGHAFGECVGLVAGKPGPLSCSGGTAAVPQDIVAGTYGRVTVSGVCRFNGDVTINGGLVVAAGGVLNSHASGVPFMTAHVVINGDVQVQNGAVLGLGNYGPPGIKTNTVVNGNIVADRPLDLYLSGITVHGSVVSNGGGPGTSQFLNFPTKDDTIDGNLIMNGWQGGWIGAIRDTVGGNVLVSNNASVVHETPVGCDDMDPNPANHCTGFAPGPDTDSTEVVTNTITGNLICVGNTPAAQVGDSGGLPNVVGGHAFGECAKLG